MFYHTVKYLFALQVDDDVTARLDREEVDELTVVVVVTDAATVIGGDHAESIVKRS